MDSLENTPSICTDISIRAMLKYHVCSLQFLACARSSRRGGVSAGRHSDIGGESRKDYKENIGICRIRRAELVPW